MTLNILFEATKMDSTKVEFGKHYDKTYYEMYQNQKDYIEWCKKQTNPNSKMISLIKYCDAKDATAKATIIYNDMDDQIVPFGFFKKNNITYRRIFRHGAIESLVKFYRGFEQPSKQIKLFLEYYDNRYSLRNKHLTIKEQKYAINTHCMAHYNKIAELYQDTLFQMVKNELNTYLKSIMWQSRFRPDYKEYSTEYWNVYEGLAISYWWEIPNCYTVEKCKNFDGSFLLKSMNEETRNDTKKILIRNVFCNDIATLICKYISI